MRLALPITLIAVVVAVARYRRGVEVWHVAVDDTSGQPPDHVEGP
ncbi:hypothetical protein [Mycobacterium seoulense]|nr:hypothetical protein [Mycobacterium seoulense]